MRVQLQCDSVAVGRTLSDLLALMGCEIASAEATGLPLLQLQGGVLRLLNAQDLPHPLPQPISLADLAQHIIQLQSTARGAPMALANGWRMEPMARMLQGPNQQHVPLTEKECLLLGALYTAGAAGASREQLLKKVWSYEADVETHTLETHMYRLRSKLSALIPPPCDITTSDGTYRLVLE